MDDSGYYTTGLGDFDVCSRQDSARHLFSLKFSDLPASQYSCFLHGFKDEQDFEDFKQDLRDFQKLKRQFVCRCVDGGGDNDGGDDLIDLAELQFICKNNYVCKRRRGCASRGARPCSGALVVPRAAPLRLPPTAVHAGSSTADVPSDSKYQAPLNYGLQQAVNKPLTAERPGSSCRTSHVGVTASSVGCDRSDDLELSISDILMEFLNKDEHFLEFEQVFEAVRNRRISRDLDTRHMSHLDTGRRISSHVDTGHRISSITDTGAYTRLDSSAGDKSPKDVQQPSLACDIFTDFFDSDESFLEFEKEFERFRSGRRSCLLENRHDRNSTDGVFGDPHVCCGQEARSDSPCYSPCCSYNEIDRHRSVAYSAKDWTKMIRNIRRSSCMSLYSETDRRLFKHRYSVGEMSEDCQRKEELNTAHPMSDLRRFDKHEPSPNSPQELTSQGESRQREQVTASSNIQPSSHNQQDLLTPEADLWIQSSVTPTRDESGLADSRHTGHDSSTGQSSAMSEDHSRPSSPGHCCSSSCFCQSDLFIEEAGDNPQINSHPPHSFRVRSFSLMNFGNQAPVTDFRLHTNSLENLSYFKRCHRSGSSVAGSLLQSLSHDNVKCFGDIDDSLSASTPCGSCSRLSFADSEHYHTATSDLSVGYSTAKSNLSHLIDRLESAVIDQRDRQGSTQEPDPNRDSCLSDYTFDPANTPEPGSIPGDQYTSCRQRDDWPAGCEHRPGSSCACQYTCHEHCVPSVTLSCKSVSGDGCDIAAARISGPADPRSHGDACLFMGNIQARPGAARIVSGSTADTPTTPAARTSESVPNFQHLSPGRGAAGHMDTPRPFNIPSHHRSWSISEDIVTPHSGLIQNPGALSDLSRGSPSPRTSSPHCQPAYSDSHFDSFPHGNTCRQSQLHASAPRAESHCVGEGVLSQHSKGGDGPTGDCPALDLPDVYRRDEDTSAATEKDETDSGYRSGTIPDDKLPRVSSQATVDQQELQRKVTKYNHFVPAACLEVTGKESFQGFMKVTMNLIRPITMELGARPPSIYELLTREHIVEENTQHVAFYMPRDTHKSLHITSDTTTKEVIASLLKKFHILDHPRKFAMYEQEFSDRNKLVRLRRLTDKDCPLRSMVNWDPERIKNYRMVLQENETGEIVWDAFSLPELNNFLRVLDREEKETVKDLKHKYAYMKQYMERRMAELRGEATKRSKAHT